MSKKDRIAIVISMTYLFIVFVFAAIGAITGAG
jgi:hypothetical protein